MKCRNKFPLANANHELSGTLLKLPALRMAVSEQTKLVLVFFSLFCCHRELGWSTHALAQPTNTRYRQAPNMSTVRLRDTHELYPK